MEPDTRTRYITVWERVQIYLLPLLLVIGAVLVSMFYAQISVSRAEDKAYATADDSADEQINTFRVSVESRFETLEMFSDSLALTDWYAGSDGGLQGVMETICEKTSFAAMFSVDEAGAVRAAYGEAVDAGPLAASCQGDTDAASCGTSRPARQTAAKP